MYEILLKWGADSLTKAFSQRGEKNVSVLIEAMKTKNALVLERFKYARNASESIIELSLEIDEELPRFREAILQSDGSQKATNSILTTLKHEFHPTYYRRFKQIRSHFESSNDVLAAYSIVMSDVLNFSMIEEIVEVKKFRSKSDVFRAYRGLWMLYAEITTKLIRLTSNDLRFWLTETPHIDHAVQFARDDLETVREFLLAPDWGGEYLRISLETDAGLDMFWSTLSA